jgi:hypothetical protein
MMVIEKYQCVKIASLGEKSSQKIFSRVLKILYWMKDESPSRQECEGKMLKWKRNK